MLSSMEEKERGGREEKERETHTHSTRVTQCMEPESATHEMVVAICFRDSPILLLNSSKTLELTEDRYLASILEPGSGGRERRERDREREDTLEKEAGCCHV